MLDQNLKSDFDALLPGRTGHTGLDRPSRRTALQAALGVVAIPPGLIRSFMPATKLRTSWTCASTLLATRRSACTSWASSSCASSRPKNLVTVEMLRGWRQGAAVP